MTFRPMAVAAVVVSVFTACESQPTELPGTPLFAIDETAAQHREIAAIRAATSRFQDVNVALAAGYQAASECVSTPLGGMGIHYINMPLAMDAGYSPEQPEALLYQPQADGTLKLVGVEFVVFQQPWHAAGNTAPPQFQGRTFAQGPGMYTQHVWVWTNNPNGMLEPFNPKVTCPAGVATAGHEH